MSYKDSLSLIVGNAISILIIGPLFLQKCEHFLCKSWQDVAQASVEFKAYMTEMVQEERELVAAGKQSKPNLMTSLVGASQPNLDFKTDDSNLRRKQYALTEEEISGNMFLFNLAGHDTISHTICWAINLLAAHPDVQEWLSEEINSVFLDPDSAIWNYEESFPRLN